MKKSAYVSEIFLFIVLFAIVGLTRVYVGDPGGPMVVWKGEFTLADTLVNVNDMAKMSRQELETQHRDTFYQMIEMGLLDDAEQTHFNKTAGQAPKKAGQ